MNKDIKLDNNQELQKNRMLKEMKKEIKDLEFQVNHTKLASLKIKLLKHLQLFLCNMRLATPFAIAIVANYALFAKINTPFKRDDVKTYAITKEVKDNKGKYSFEKGYGSFEENIDTIYYYGKWKNDNNIFSRNVKMYDLKDIEEDVIGNILNDNYNFDLEGVLGRPTSVIVETKSNLTEEEINGDEYIEVTLYNKDKNDYIYLKESVTNNTIFTLLFFLTYSLFLQLSFSYRDKISKFNYSESIRRIKNNYPEIYKGDLVKKLQIKKSNYDRLVK